MDRNLRHTEPNWLTDHKICLPRNAIDEGRMFRYAARCLSPLHPVWAVNCLTILGGRTDLAAGSDRFAKLRDACTP